MGFGFGRGKRAKGPGILNSLGLIGSDFKGIFNMATGRRAAGRSGTKQGASVSGRGRGKITQEEYIKQVTEAEKITSTEMKEERKQQIEQMKRGREKAEKFILGSFGLKVDEARRLLRFLDEGKFEEARNYALRCGVNEKLVLDKEASKEYIALLRDQMMKLGFMESGMQG